MAQDHVDKPPAVILELAFTDAWQHRKGIQCCRLFCGHRFQGAVVKNEVGRYTLLTGQDAAVFPQGIEQAGIPPCIGL